MNIETQSSLEKIRNYDIFVFNNLKNIINSKELSVQNLEYFHMCVLYYEFNNILYYIYLKDLLDEKQISKIENIPICTEVIEGKEKSKVDIGLSDFAKSYALYILQNKLNVNCNDINNIYQELPDDLKNNYFIQIMFDLSHLNRITNYETPNDQDSIAYQIIYNNLLAINDLLSLDPSNKEIIWIHFNNIFTQFHYRFNNVLYYFEIRWYLKNAIGCDENGDEINGKITESSFLELLNEYLTIWGESLKNRFNLDNNTLDHFFNKPLIQIFFKEK